MNDRVRVDGDSKRVRLARAASRPPNRCATHLARK